MTRTKYLNAYRKKHPKLRNKCRKSNYIKSRPIIRKNISWGPLELMLLNSNLKDIEISVVIKRSVQAIQQKRYKLSLQK